jgi:hypothetical protein
MKRTWLLGGTAFKSEAVRFMSSMLSRCHNSLRAVQSKADALSHFIGRKKANAIKIARQPVGVLSNIFNGIIAVFLVDTNGKKGADAVRLQKHHHFPDRTMVNPGISYHFKLLLSDSPYLRKSSNLLFKNIKRFVAKMFDNFPGCLGTDALNEP